MRSDEHTVDPAEVELKLFSEHGFDDDDDDDGSAMFTDEEASAAAYKLVAGRPARRKASGESSSAMALHAVKRAAVGVGARALFYPTLAYKLVARGKASSSATTLDAAKHAAVGVGARALFYPTLAYSMARNQLSSDYHWWDAVDGTHVLLGAVPFPSDVPRLHALGVTAVVTLTEPYERLVPTSLYKQHEMENLVLPTTDYLYAPSQDDLRRATAFIHGKEAGGGLTYVHCKAGRARSATLVMCYLVRYKGMTAVEAYDKVRSCRPRVSLAPAQWQAVRDFDDFYRRPPAAGSE
ncbi:Protein-tyrosine phosphatase mitochondrial 1-like protein [Hordeum vulgare]|nr:Protein-tyrosine phosphatase mitochondrial 1-like protein [Hordeum vulgare]